VRLLFDSDLAARFRDRCRPDPDTAVADLLYGLSQTPYRGNGSQVALFSGKARNRSAIPVGCEHVIEWALVRLWCESVRRPDNVLDLLAEDGAGARFIAMTKRSLAVALSGTGDANSRAELAVRWACLLEERRDESLRNESERELYDDPVQSKSARLHQGLRHLDRLREEWLELGTDAVHRPREGGLVRLIYAGDVAWEGFVSNVQVSLMAVTSDGMLETAASREWWDLRPSLLRIQFMGAEKCTKALAASTLEEQDSANASRGPTPEPTRREWAIAAEAALIERDRPFLNLPFWPRPRDQSRR